MRTIEYTTIDKSQWRRGPWDNEVDKKQWLDAASGLPCMIRRAGSMGHWCGYVGVPRNHPLYRRDYNDIDVDVHGGLTFADACRDGPDHSAICHKVEPGEDDDVWWLGFDCGHDGDISPGMQWVRPDGFYRDQAYVEDEVVRLAKQLHQLANETQEQTPRS